MSDKYTIEEAEDGLVIKAKDGYELDTTFASSTEQRISVMEDTKPRIGQRVMLDGKLIEVAELRYEGPVLKVRDEILGGWHTWA